ncbi:class I SAM-dependent methyltransferase [Pseudomonas sp. GD03944]|uniref:class I SAM-dependent methyltransferase n=1 Tax=Pseudomonas sp. GD03944 TaxID=2975409 RepID=UPI0024469317|nr:class I SAM-dependent methyltransferase [Pseudomonas sp. GD03944]MDH1261692.1 class I SAM-dependent methyltransferase [Pseudomonas sp. GD03944]
MQREEIEALFDQHAASYDEQWANLAPMRDALNLLISSALSALPADAHVLCVGAGTGSEILYLAQQFPGWRFTVLEPSAAMMEACRRRTEAHGIAARCDYHTGYLETLPSGRRFNGATSLLVSQFILDREERTGFFREIAERLVPDGYLFSADLSADQGTDDYRRLLDVWLRMLTRAEVPKERVDQMTRMYARDVGVLPPEQVGTIIRDGGFNPPTPIFQGGLIHAWFTTLAPLPD